MNQEKIGKFIFTCRKNKNLTQAELATKLGVTEKSISNWENGRNMPDLSLFKPLCDELDITINDLLSGEKIDNKDYKNKSEENIINTLEYTNQKVNNKSNIISYLLIIFGILLIFNSFTILPSESSWGSIYSIIGTIITIVGLNKFIKKKSLIKKIIINILYVTSFIFILILVDYLSVNIIKEPPRFAYIKESGENIIIYKAPFYNVYRINPNSANEYYIIDNLKKYNEETIPLSPFNRQKSGIDNIIKYQNKYIGNNSNIGNLINNLPLHEYGYVFQIDSTNLGLTINYHTTDWYIYENNYLKKSLIYNSVSIFSLIGNVNYITYNFSGKTYHITRKDINANYPNFNDIIKDNLNKDNFTKYLESKLLDNNFTDEIFNKLFNQN